METGIRTACHWIYGSLMRAIGCLCIYVRLPYPLTMNGMHLVRYCRETGLLLTFHPQGRLVDISVLSATAAHVTTMCYANADRLSLNKCLYF